jgi:hypothetical protein
MMTLDEDGPVIVAFGELGSGFQMFGPFPNQEDAIEWARREEEQSGGTWETFHLHNPEEM